MLLAVLGAVPDFGHAILRPLGAPKGQITTYVEVPLKDNDGKVHRPDGVVVVERGQTRWSCLVEVKTGDGELTTDQVTRYVDMAKKHGFDAVVTLSSTITPTVDDLPFTIHGSKLRSTSVKHLSWWRVITEAVVQQRHRGVADPDQAWILSELIAYLQHEASGAAGFRDMGASWVTARDAAHAGTLRPADKAAKELCVQFERLSDYLSLSLAQELGVGVRVVRSRKATVEERLGAALARVVEAGCLETAIRIEDTAGDLALCADLRAKRVSARCEVKAPDETKPLTRIKWLVRQVAEAPADLRIDVAFRGTGETTSELLRVARDEPERLLSPSDPKREPKSFVLELARPMGAKRGRGKGTFVTETERLVNEFYGVVLQNLTEWRPKAPKLREPEPVAVPTPAADADPAVVWASIDEDENLSDLEKYRLKVKHMEEREKAGAEAG